MSYKYNNVVIKPGLYLGDQGALTGDTGASSPIFSSMQLSLATNGLSRRDDNLFLLPGYKAILYKNTDISYITVSTIDNTTGTDIKGVWYTTYNTGGANQISKVDLFYNNVKIDYSNIKTMGFKASARLCWGAKLGEHSDGSYNKYALVLESSTPKRGAADENETSGLIGLNRPYLSLPWIQPIVTTNSSISFWWCSKGYENGVNNAGINYELSLYSAIGVKSSIFNLNDGANDHLQMFFESGNTGQLTFSLVNQSTTGYSHLSTKNICDGLWHHIVWNISGGSWTIYTDGVAETSVSKASYNMGAITTYSSTIGTRNVIHQDNQTNGYIADFRFYKNVLSPTEINGLLNGDHTYKTTLDVSSCLFQYTFAPDAVYTNNYTTYAIGAATVPYAAELRNGADILMPSMDLTDSLGKNIKIYPFTIGSNGFSISFWWRSDGLWATQGENSRLFYLGNGDETNNITFSLEIGSNGYPSIQVVNNDYPIIDGITPFIWYKFDGNVLNSGSGTGLNGTGTPSFSSSTVAYGTQSLNTSSSFNVPSVNLNSLNGITFSWWVNSINGTVATFTNGTDSFDIVVGTNAAIRITEPTFGESLVSDLNSGQWNHLAVSMTYSSGLTSTWKCYLNGILKRTFTGRPYFSVNNYTTNTIGNTSGFFDDFRIYQTVLSDSQILKLTNTIQKDLTTLTDFSDDTWKHVVWTMTPESTWKLYVNNALINTYTGMAYPNVIQRSTNYIGSGYLTTDRYPCGYIGDFRMYNATLSSVNVTSLYKQTDTTDNEMNLIQHYDFVEETMNANNNILYSNAPRYALELTNVAASDSASPGQYGSMTSGLAATGTNGLTFSFWWKAKGRYAAQGTWSRIFDFADNTSGDNSIIFACKSNTSGNPYIEIIRGTAASGGKTSVNLPDLTDFCDGDWKHVVWTMTSATTQTSTWNLYVNNKRYGLGNLTTTGWYPIDKTRTNCFIGKSWAVNDGYPNGHISDVRVYGEVFTPQKITDLYNKVYTSTTNVILHTLTPNTTPPKISDKFLDLINTKSPWGIYFADSYDNNILYEARNNGRNASTSGITKNYASGNGAAASIPYINGTTTSTITWPTGSIPTTFTICSITRYTTSSSTNGRILVNLNEAGVNFLHGHFGNKRGLAHYNTWKTGNTTSAGTLTDWLVMCGTNGTNSTPGNILRDGTGVGTANGGTGNSKLSVNSYEPSDFALSTVFIWDEALTNAEMIIVSNALTYHLSSGMPINLELSGAKIPTSITQIIPYNSLYLDGTAIKWAQASLTASLITNAGVSFAFWFKPTGTHGSYARIFDFGNSTQSDNIIFGRYSTNNYPMLQIYNGVGQASSTTATLTNESDFFSNQVWKHAVWTMTYSTEATSTWNVYINGKQYGTGPVTTAGAYPTSLTRTSCLIGKSNWTLDGLLNGQVADFRVYNRVLTQANVTALYNGIFTDNTSLFLQYPIDKAGTTNPSTITFTLQSSAKIQQPTMLLATDPLLNYHRGSYLSLPPLVKPGTNGLSFSIWWRAGASYANQGPGARLFSFSNGKNKDTIEFILNRSTLGYPAIQVHNGIKFGDNSIDSLTSLCDGTWKHIVWTMTYCAPTQTTSTWIVYVNGTATSVTATGTYPKDVSRKYAYIGQSAWIQDRYPTGDFADFRVYGAVLTQANVNSLFNLSDTTDNEGNLLLRQKFDSTESYLYQTCDNIKPSVLLENDPAIVNTPTGQHVVFPALPGLLSTDVPDRRGISISFWWKAKGLSGISGMLFESGFAQDNDVFFLRTRDGLNSYMSSQFYYGTGNDVNIQFGTADGDIENLENGEWHHIVWTMSFEGYSLNSYWKYYMDGYFIKTTGLIANAYLDSANTFNARQVNNFIGRSNWATINGCLNGYMSDFRIYNKCLTTQDVGDLYTNTYDDNSDLFLRYSFEKKIKIDNVFNYSISNNVDYNQQINSTNKTISLTFSANVTIENNITDHPKGLTTAFNTGASGGYAQIASLTNGNDGMTFSFWFKPTGTSGSSARIFDFGNGQASDNIIFWKNGTTDNPRVALYRGGTLTDDVILSNNTNFYTSGAGWQHAVWTMSFCGDTATTSTWFVYINGTQYQGTGTGGALKTSCRYPAIGPRNSNFIGKSNWADGALYGMITDFRIYNRTLTAAEALALYNNTSVSTADLYFSTNFALNVPQFYTPSHSTDTTQVARLYNGATLSTDTYKFGTSSLFLSNMTTTTNPAASTGQGYTQYMSPIAPLPKLGTNGISFSFWWKSAGAQGTSPTLFDFGEGSNDNQILFWIGSSPSVQTRGPTGTQTGHVFSQTNFLDTNWHHIVWNIDKYNNNTWELFYDNASSGPLSNKVYPENVSRPYCFLGRNAFSGDGGANGYIDEFRIYSKTLTATDVSNLYTNIDTDSLKDKLIVYYSFNQDASRKVMDEQYIDNNVLDTPIFNT